MYNVLTLPMFALGTGFINVYKFSPPEFDESLFSGFVLIYIYIYIYI